MTTKFNDYQNRTTDSKLYRLLLSQSLHSTGPQRNAVMEVFYGLKWRRGHAFIAWYVYAKF